MIVSACFCIRESSITSELSPIHEIKQYTLPILYHQLRCNGELCINHMSTMFSSLTRHYLKRISWLFYTHASTNYPVTLWPVEIEHDLIKSLCIVFINCNNVEYFGIETQDYTCLCRHRDTGYTCIVLLDSIEMSIFLWGQYTTVYGNLLKKQNTHRHNHTRNNTHIQSIQGKIQELN